MSRNKYSVLQTFFDSKEDLVSKEIKALLEIEDFCNLDSLICNHERREKLLDCFSGHAFEGSKSVGLGDVFLRWARKRGIIIKKLSWKLESENSISLLLNLCEHQGWNPMALTISFEKLEYTELIGADDIDYDRKDFLPDGWVYVRDLFSIMNHSSNLMEFNFNGYASMGHADLFFSLK